MAGFPARLRQAHRLQRGGIAWLLDLLDEHQDAIEHELITHGLRLRDLGQPHLTWHDLFIIVSQASADSAVVRAIRGPDYRWGLPEYLLAGVLNGIRGLQWMLSDQSGSEPEPITPPGTTPPKDLNRFGAEPVTVDEFNEFWNS